MKKEFLIERQGKTFALYAGLIDAAHDQGLHSIETAIVQIPTEENKFVAICTAKVTMARNSGYDSFSGIGDASPQNVTPAMRNCLLRMAETRAKARALRDAVNIGVAAFEELGDEGDDTKPSPQQWGDKVEETLREVVSVTKAAIAGEKCPECFAPAGRPHGTNCSRRQAA